MKCKYYRSKEEYYGVDKDVAPLTHGFWDCEPEEEEIRDYFLNWVKETREILEPDYPQRVTLYCEECRKEIEFEGITPGEVFSREELYEINKRILDEDLAKGDIDKELYEEELKEIKELLKEDK